MKEYTVCLKQIADAYVRVFADSEESAEKIAMLIVHSDESGKYDIDGGGVGGWEFSHIHEEISYE